MMRHVIGLALLAFVISCKEAGKSPDGTQAAAPSKTEGLFFAFSSQSPDFAKEDYCHLPFSDVAVIQPDPSDVNRRLFALSDGPHKITVDYGNIVAAFILKKTGNEVDVFTSDNFPMCLSNKVNFSLKDGGTLFHYDNHKHINFDMRLVSLPNGVQVAMEIPVDSTYGIIVRR